MINVRILRLDTMKAIVQGKYGPPADVLELGDVDEPVVKDDEVLVRVHAGFGPPGRLARGQGTAVRPALNGCRAAQTEEPDSGTDVAGRVESVGRDVTRFRAGDEVFGETIRGYQWTNGGAYAEHVSVPEDQLAPKPANITFEQAAAVPTSGLIVLQNLPDEELLQPGQSVLVNGAGGGVGAIAVQIAKARSGGYRCRRDDETGDGPIARRRPGHRLHQR